MYEIKVSITEKVSPFDAKLDALAKVGAEAEALINANEALRIEVNERKYETIIEALTPIMNGYKRLYEIAKENDVPIIHGLQARLGANALGIMKSFDVYVGYADKVCCSYFNGGKSISVYPTNDMESNYAPNGIITMWGKFNIIADLENQLNKLIEETLERINEKRRKSVEALATALT